jgi:squalene-hopene/tetraprenyl-beta-curcumene cyclase
LRELLEGPVCRRPQHSVADCVGDTRLLAGGHGGPAALQRGLAHLIETQRADGEWDESLATGTGFPNVFYLRFTLYRNYFPLLALVQARTELGG